MLKAFALLALIQTGVIKADYPKCEDVYKTAVVSHAKEGRVQLGKKDLPFGVMVFFGTTSTATVYGFALVQEGSLDLVSSELFKLQGTCSIEELPYMYFTATMPGGI